MTTGEILHEQIRALEAERDLLADLLGDAEIYLQHRPTCERLLTRKTCTCGLVELQTRVHAELENGDDDEDDDDADDGTADKLP